MKSFTLLLAVLCVAVASAQSSMSAAAASIPYTPQEAVLAKAATGNFACKVNSLVVTTENPGVNPLITPQDIRSAFSNVATIEWAHIAQNAFGSFDGRNDEKILGTPGGDMGEFIQALEAYSKITQKSLTLIEVQTLLERYLSVMTRAKFFYETDEKAYMNLAVATGCRNLHVAEMGGMKHKKEQYLAEIAKPQHIGDPFIKFLAANATNIGMAHPEYVEFALSAYHNVLWTTPSKLSSRLCYLRVAGPHTEGALLNIRTPPFCVDQGLAPMASSQLACPLPIFINHVDAVKVFRRELVAVLTEKDQNVNPRDVMAEFNTLAQANLQKFWNEVSQGSLPEYTIEFVNSSPLLTTDVAFVE